MAFIEIEIFVICLIRKSKAARYYGGSVRVILLFFSFYLTPYVLKDKLPSEIGCIFLNIYKV